VPAAPDTFPALLLAHANVRGSRPAIREKDLGIWQTLTWSEVAEHVRHVAQGLASLGIQPGMHVAVIGENRPRLYMAMMAAQSLGAIPVPLYQDAVAQEMVYVLQDAEISVAIVEDQEQVDKMIEVREQCPALKHVVFDDPRGLRHYADPMLLSYEQLEALGSEYAAKHPDFYARAVAAVQPQLAAATDAVKDAGQHALETAKSSAQDAAQELKSSAADHAHEVTDEAKGAAAQVKETAQQGDTTSART